MKKITIVLTTVFFASVCAFTANADSYKYTPYVGADYTFGQTDAVGFEPHYHVAGVHIGSDYGKYFSTELFANQSTRAKNNGNTGDIRTSYYNYGLDILAYLPICLEDKLSLLATAGIGEYVYKTKFSPTDRHNEHGYGYRFGGGAKFAFDSHWQTRLIVRYVNFDKLSGYDHATEYSFGVEYHF